METGSQGTICQYFIFFGSYPEREFMILPFMMEENVKQLSVEMSYEKLFTQLFVHSVRLRVITHNGRNPPPPTKKNNQNPKATTKYSLCVKLLTSDLAGKKKKNLVR